jgi:hypothetical protein
MILAHHGGEAGLATAVVATVSSAPIVLALLRARFGELLDRTRRWQKQ